MVDYKLRQRVWEAREQLARELGVQPTPKAILSRLPEAKDTNEIRYHLAFAGRYIECDKVEEPTRYLQPVSVLTLKLGRIPRRVDIYDAGLAECPEIAGLARRMAERFIPCPSTPLGKSLALAQRWHGLHGSAIPVDTLAFVLECSVSQAEEYLSQLSARGLHSAT